MERKEYRKADAMKKTVLTYILGVVVAGMLLVAAGGAFYYFHAIHYSDDSTRKADVAALSEDAYDLLLLTMFSEDTVKTYPFEYYMAYNTYIIIGQASVLLEGSSFTPLMNDRLYSAWNTTDELLDAVRIAVKVKEAENP